MKIPVKTVKIIEVEKVVTTMKDVPSICSHSIPDFQLLADYLLTCKFVASSTYFIDFKSFLGFDQGVGNRSKLNYIEVIHEFNNKITVRVMWMGCSNVSRDGAIIIFEKPIQE